MLLTIGCSRASQADYQPYLLVVVVLFFYNKFFVVRSSVDLHHVAASSALSGDDFYQVHAQTRPDSLLIRKRSVFFHSNVFGSTVSLRVAKRSEKGLFLTVCLLVCSAGRFFDARLDSESDLAVSLFVAPRGL